MRILFVHEFADGQLKLLFHVALLEEFVEELLHPLVEDATLSDHLEHAADPQCHTQDKSPILETVRWEVVAQFSLQISQKSEMLGYVRVEDCVNYQGACFLLQLILHVLHNVALRVSEQDRKAGCQMMVLKDTDVRVADGQGVLSTHNKLV